MSDLLAFFLAFENVYKSCQQGPEVVEQEVVEHPDENQEPEANGNLMKRHSAEEVISEDHGAMEQEGVEVSEISFNHV